MTEDLNEYVRQYDALEKHVIDCETMAAIDYKPGCLPGAVACLLRASVAKGQTVEVIDILNRPSTSRNKHNGWEVLRATVARVAEAEGMVVITSYRFGHFTITRLD